MWARRFALGTFLAAALLASVADPASAQSDAELKALDRRVERLNDAGKDAEALAVAEAYVEVAKKRRGEQHPEYAKAVGWLAQLLQQANRPAEAEPLYRRALAIEEKSFGPDHPTVAADLGNLATLLQDAYRFGEAEPL